ncbi:hypothetical protein UlMin_008843 [Ulmus minor]
MESTPAAAVRPMNGGDGRHSYTKNSDFQRKAIDASKELIRKAISEKLDIEILSSSSIFKLADLGCSVGPNTFFSVQNIIDAVELKCQIQEKAIKLPEFLVFFSDQTLNDFNQLFQSLPPERPYFASGLPGSFHSRLFPSAFLHFVHSSYALHFLSGFPKEMEDKSSPAWNQGRINHSNASDEVVRCYEAQFSKDLENFLDARAQELVDGGLMGLIIPGRSHGTPHSQVFGNNVIELIGSCLVDMANKGIVSYEKIDSFNFPWYFSSLEQVESIVHRTGFFSIETMESFPQVQPELEMLAYTARAAFEGIIETHFGHEIIDDLFILFEEKLKESSSFYETGECTNLFILLKRIVTM